MRIVVIEDSKTQAARLKFLLEANGYQVDLAPDGEAGLDACSQAPPPHAVITDVVMPGLDGFEVTQRLKANEALRDVPVMLLTSLDRPDAVVRAVAAGADNFITKPYEDEKLLLRLSRMIDGSRPTSEAVIIEGTEGPVVIDGPPTRLATLLHSALEDASERAAQLERHRAQLEQATHQRVALMRIVAHELRNPLSALSYRAQLDLLANEAAASDPKSTANVVKRNVARMVRIIDDLVDVTNIDLGTLTTARSAIDLVQVVNSAVDEVRESFPHRRFTLESPEQVHVHADPRRMEQVLTNLLTNAIKYSNEHSPVAVALTLDGDQARVSVTDEGIGLTPEDANKIFDRYYRTKDGQDQADGAGLGLHICKHIIDLHGGAIDVDSQLGKGSVFWFELPIA